MSVQVITDADLHETLAAHDKVIIKYHADWCGSCKLFAPKYRRMSEMQQFEGIVFVDVNSEDNPMARKLAEVDNLPFFATFKSGEIIDRTATAKEDTVLKMLEKLQQ